MSMLYRPLVSPLASRGRPEPPGAPLCEAPARARNTRLLEVGSDPALAPLCATAHCSRLASAILAIAAGHASGSSTCDRRGDRAVSQECKSQWETSGGGGSSWNGSPDFRRRRARSARASILMGCGPSPPRRSPANVTTSPASRSISSSSVRPPFA